MIATDGECPQRPTQIVTELPLSPATLGICLRSAIAAGLRTGDTLICHDQLFNVFSPLSCFLALQLKKELSSAVPIHRCHCSSSTSGVGFAAKCETYWACDGTEVSESPAIAI